MGDNMNYFKAIEKYYEIHFFRIIKSLYVHKITAGFTKSFSTETVVVWIFFILGSLTYGEPINDSYVLVVLGILVAIMTVIIKRDYINKRYGHTPKNLNIYQREKPSNLRPAHVRMLVNDGLVDKVSLVTTLMDLIDRGYLQVDRSESERQNLNDFRLIRTNKNDSELLKYEKFLIKWLFDKYDDDNIVPMKKIKILLTNNVMEENPVVLFDNWAALVNLSYPIKLFYKNCIKENKVRNFIYGFFIILALLLMYGEESIPGILGIIGVYCVGAGLFCTPKYMLNQLGAEERDSWLDLKEYLKDFSNMKDKDIENVKLWGFYLTYAIALDIETTTEFEFLEFFKWPSPDEIAEVKNDRELKIIEQIDENSSDEIIHKEIENEMKIYDFKTFY